MAHDERTLAAVQQLRALGAEHVEVESTLVCGVPTSGPWLGWSLPGRGTYGWARKRAGVTADALAIGALEWWTDERKEDKHG